MFAFAEFGLFIAVDRIFPYRGALGKAVRACLSALASHGTFVTINHPQHLAAVRIGLLFHAVRGRELRSLRHSAAWN
jgi:hypothetical protein